MTYNQLLSIFCFGLSCGAAISQIHSPYFIWWAGLEMAAGVWFLFAAPMIRHLNHSFGKGTEP